MIGSFSFTGADGGLTCPRQPVNKAINTPNDNTKAKTDALRHI
jgi:hypothetical protein